MKFLNIYITKNSGLHKKVNICNNMYIKNCCYHKEGGK